MSPNEVPVARNVRLYFAFTSMASFLLWAAIWIKYLIDVRHLERRAHRVTMPPPIAEPLPAL